MQMEILFKKSGISNPPDACIRDNPCLPKFGTLYGLCPQVSKRGRDTESDANIQQEEMLTFFSNEFPPAFPHEIPKYVSKPYYLSTQSTICFVRQFLFLPYLYCIISWFVISFHSSFVMPSFSSVSTICTQSGPNVRYRLPPTVVS